MRIDESLETTAADIVHEFDEKSLADLIYQYGQDRASRRIARYIVRRREHEPITTTGQLAQVVAAALGTPGKKHRSRIHPATRTFQALRIAVNHELDNLEQLLEAAPGLLARDGYVAIISYHSLEDGLVNATSRRTSAGHLSDPDEKPSCPARKRSPSTAGPERKLRIAPEELTGRNAQADGRNSER
jgi:16S rRNA (cytosine1402-N4)-methyltransferase